MAVRLRYQYVPSKQMYLAAVAYTRYTIRVWVSYGTDRDAQVGQGQVHEFGTAAGARTINADLG